VERVSNGVIKLVDASPNRNGGGGGVGGRDWFGDLHPEKYWRGEKYYRVVFESRRLVRFVVLDVELCHSLNKNNINGTADRNKSTTTTTNKRECNTELEKSQTSSSSSTSPPANGENALYTGPKSNLVKYALADVEVARESDLGTTDETFHCTTHLGNLLQTGDVVLGYDLLTSVMPGYDEMVLSSRFGGGAFNSSFVLPDVVLVKKAKIGAVVEEGGEDALDAKGNTGAGGNERAKSSGSKKRERRRRKVEKKAKALEETAVRMGFAEETKNESEGDLHNAHEPVQEEEQAFQQSGLQDDSDLAEELDRAEKVLLLEAAAAAAAAASDLHPLP